MQVLGGSRRLSGSGGARDGGLPTSALVAAVDASVGWDAAGWDAATRHGVLADLDRVIATLETARGAVLIAEQAAGTWRGSGDPSLAAWRGRTSRAGKRAAATQVRRAEGLAAAPRAAGAVTGGQIGLEHASVIARLASTGTEAQRAVVTSDEGQRELVGMAARLDADTFATAAARFVAEHEPGSLEHGHEAQRAARFLHLATTSSGTVVKGRLDNMAGHRLRLALEAVTPRPGADDDRDAGQRAADGLDTIARAVLADVETKPGGHVPAQVTMILSAEDWAAAQAERSRRRAGARARARARAGVDADAGRAGAGDAERAGAGDVGSAPVRVRPATLEDGTPVPGSELARTMCDAAVTRLVIDAESRPLDVGRAERVFTGPRRRAVVARDRHCGWPGCRMNARWCEVHHLDWWDRDHGRTDVARGVLLCSFHHHEVHRRDLQLHPAGPAAVGDVAMIAYEVHDQTGRLTCPATPGPGTPPRARARGSDGSGGGGGGGDAPPRARQPSENARSPESIGTPDATGPPDVTRSSGGSGLPQSLPSSERADMPGQGELDLLHGDSGDPGRVFDPDLTERGPRPKVA